MLNKLAYLVAIPSVEAPPSGENAPFGAEVRRALDAFLRLADEAGLKTGENKGYYGYAELGDPAKPIIGIAAHLDVVPAGPGWEGDPFNLRIEDGRAYGRGVADDKGPLVAALEALKKLAGDGEVLNHRVRLIAGCNEETGSKCLKRYAAEDEIPVATIVPDADFPVINSEKGILHLSASFEPDEKFAANVVSLSAGERVNVVPGYAELVLRGDGETVENLKKTCGLGPELFRLPGVTARLVEVDARAEDLGIEVGENIKITAVGSAGHAADPDKCENALWKALAFLAGVMPDSPTVRKLVTAFCRRGASVGLGIAAEDEASGALTMNLGVARYDGDDIKLGFDFRLPLCITADEVERKIRDALPERAVIKRDSFANNLFVAEDSPLVKALLETYSEVTGEKDPRPVKTGGGTYARELPNAVAFGPTFPGEETDIHNADENMSVAHLFKLVDIYYAAIKRLDKTL